MKTLLRLVMPVWLVLLLASSAPACPLCESETGRQVRAGIFDDDFGKNVALTLIPFPVLAVIVAFIYHGPPTIRRPHGVATDLAEPDKVPPA